MATKLDFEVPPPPFPGVQEDLDNLLKTLHRTGTLRTLNDFFGRLDQVAEVGLDELNSPAGRNLLGALLGLGEMLAKLPADDVARVAGALSRGLKKAGEVVKGKPPGTVKLLWLLHHSDTRRALGGLLTVLRVTGAVLGRKKRR